MYLAIRKRSIHWRIHAKLSITCKCFQIHEIYMRSKCLKKLHQKSRLHITPSVAILLCRHCKNFLLALCSVSQIESVRQCYASIISWHSRWPLYSLTFDLWLSSRESHVLACITRVSRRRLRCVTDRQTNRESCSSDALASVWVCQTQQRSASCCMTHLNDESRTQRATDKSNLHTPLRPPVRTWIELTT